MIQSTHSYTADFVIVDHGSLWLLWPLSISAADWLQETAPKEDVMFFHSALAVEPRYVHGVLRAIHEAGFVAGYQTAANGNRRIETMWREQPGLRP